MSHKITALATTLLSAAAFAGTAPAADAGQVRYAHSPTGNIACKAQSYYGGDWNLMCSALSPGRTMELGTSGLAFEAPFRPIPSQGRTMQYGHTYHFGPYACSVDPTYGIDCFGQSEYSGDVHGFTLSRQSATSY